MASVRRAGRGRLGERVSQRAAGTTNGAHPLNCMTEPAVGGVDGHGRTERERVFCAHTHAHTNTGTQAHEVHNTIAHMAARRVGCIIFAHWCVCVAVACTCQGVMLFQSNLK